MPDDLKPTADPYEWNDENRRAVGEHVRTRYDVFNRGRENFLPWAYRNILFYRGHQWVFLDRMQPTYWRPVRPKDPSMPMPVENKFGRLADAFTAMVGKFDPSITYAPATDEPEDRATAELSTRIVDVIGDEVGITTSRQRGARWFVLTGGYWRETGYDNDPAHGTVSVPMMVCAGCGYQAPVDPETPTIEGAPPAMQPGAEAAAEMPVDPMMAMGVDPMAMGGLDPMLAPPCPECQQPLAEQAVDMPKGRMYVTERSAFEMFFDASVVDWSRQRDYICQNAVDEDQAKGRWTKLAPDAIKADTTGGNMYRESLPTVGPGPGMLQRGMFGTGGRQGNTKVTENWYWSLPTKEYPQGLLVVMLGKTPTDAGLAHFGPLPYYYTEADDSKAYFLPHVFIPQLEVPGSAWPKTVMDDLAELQRELNTTLMMIRLSKMRMSNSVWLSVRGSSLSSPTGTPGQFMEYSPVPGAAEPKRLDGRPIPQSFFADTERIKRAMDELGISTPIMQGLAEPGVRTAIGTNMLREKAEAQYGPMFVRINHAEAEWSRQALAIFRLYATEERLHRIKGRDGQWEVKSFMAGDLRGRVDVIPESGVTMPRTTMSERAEMQDAVAMGLLNPQDPAQKRVMLEKMGMLHYLPLMDRDVKRAEMENEAFRALAADPNVIQASPAMIQQVRQTVQMEKANGTPPPAILAIVEGIFDSVGLPIPRIHEFDDHSIHGQEHRVDAKGESFLTRPPLAQLIESLHIAAHDFLQGQLMQAVSAIQQPPSRMPAGAPGAKPGPDAGSAPNPANPARSSSSPARLGGEMREMARTGA